MGWLAAVEGGRLAAGARGAWWPGPADAAGMWRGSGAAAGAGAGTEQHVAGGRGGSVPVSRRSTSRPPNKYTLHHPSQPAHQPFLPFFPPAPARSSRTWAPTRWHPAAHRPGGQLPGAGGPGEDEGADLEWGGEGAAGSWRRGLQHGKGLDGRGLGRAWRACACSSRHPCSLRPAGCTPHAALPVLRPTALLTPHLAPPALPASASPLSQELGAKFDEVEIPADMAELAAEYREKLIEQVAELDDDVMMGYLDVSGVMGYLAWPAGVAGGGLGGHHGSCRCCCRRLPPVSVLGALLPASGLEVPPPPALPVPQPPALPAPQRPAPPAPPSPPQGELPDEATIRRLIRSGTIAGKFVPMTCGTAFKNKGVQPLLDAVVDYLPAPTDLPDVRGSDIDDAEKVRRGAWLACRGWGVFVSCVWVGGCKSAGCKSAERLVGVPPHAPLPPASPPRPRPPAGDDAQVERRRALLGPGLQDHDRPLCRLPHLCARVLRRAGGEPRRTYGTGGGRLRRAANSTNSWGSGVVRCRAAAWGWQRQAALPACAPARRRLAAHRPPPHIRPLTPPARPPAPSTSCPRSRAPTCCPPPRARRSGWGA